MSSLNNDKSTNNNNEDVDNLSEEDKDFVAEAFRGVLASLQHVVPKWSRLQNFTSASKTAPSSSSKHSHNKPASNQNYASTGDLRVLCAMGGGVGELHDTALRDYFFTELADKSSNFSGAADDLLFIVVPNAVACPKNNYPPSSSLSSTTSNNNKTEVKPNSTTVTNDSFASSSAAASPATPNNTPTSSVGDKIAGAFKIFGRKISNLVSKDNSNNSNNNNKNDSPSSPATTNNNNNNAVVDPMAEHEAMLEKLRNMAPEFLSLVTSTHLCADSHDPIASGEYAIKSSTILVFRRGTNPLQNAVEQASDYIQKYDAMINGNSNNGHNSAASITTQRNLSASVIKKHSSSSLSADPDDDEEDELRRSSRHSSHQAFLADPPIRRLSSNNLGDLEAGNESPNPVFPNKPQFANEPGSPKPTIHNTNNTHNNVASPLVSSSSASVAPPVPPNFCRILNIPREPNWFATVALNLACQWPFYLNVAVVKMLRSTELSSSNTPSPVAIRTVQRQVYPTLNPPRNIAGSGSGKDAREATNAFGGDDTGSSSFSYPDLHYSVDDFEEAFGDIRLAPGHKLAVLLTAGGPPGEDSDAVAVFRGVVNYENLMQQLKKQEQATGVSLASQPGATKPSNSGSNFNNNSYHNNASPPAVVPLKSQSGRAEVAIWLTEADVEAQKLMNMQTQNEINNNNNNNNSTQNILSNNGSMIRGLQGSEILHCALTRVSLQASHVVSAMLQGVPWSSLHASWLPKQSNNPVTKNKWMIFPPSKDHLTKWLEDDNSFNKARAAAGTGTTSDDVKKMLGTS